MAAAVDLGNVLRNHEGLMNRKIRESREPTRRPPVPSDFRVRQICQVKASGVTSAWTPYTVEFAETKFTKDFPAWEVELVKCPPGEIYYGKMKPYVRATDLEMKYLNRPTKEWGHRKDVGDYTRRIGDMAENLVKLAVER